MHHEDYCSINEIGVCSCGLAAAYGPWVGGAPIDTGPKEMADDEAVRALIDVDHLASCQDRIQKLRSKGIVLCRKA